MEVSKHGGKRIRSRVGVNKKSVDRVAQKAFEEGVTHKETKGNLHKWMDKMFLSHYTGNQMRIYGDKLYLFQDEILVTVIDIPRNLLPAAYDAKRRKKQELAKLKAGE